MTDAKVTQHSWQPIDPLPAETKTWNFDTHNAIAKQWQNTRKTLRQHPEKDAMYQQWLTEYKRLFALENGQIEGLYVLSENMTKTCISHGFTAATIPHQQVSQLVNPKNIHKLWEDQYNAYNLMFSYITGERPLSTYALKEIHQLLTRHQHSIFGVDPSGQNVMLPLRQGAFKTLPNNPQTLTGTVHEYCPPEHVQTELERLFNMYKDIQAENYPAPIEAAWLHHRFVRIHPFQDGNGRTARLLMAYAFLRHNELPPIILSGHKSDYIAELNVANTGDLRPFTDFLAYFAQLRMKAATRTGQAILDGNKSVLHINGDVSRVNMDTNTLQKTGHIDDLDLC